MRTDEIKIILSQVLSHTRTNFLGVFALDQIPSTFTQYPCAYVANTDPSSHKGQHWVAFYHDSPTHLEFFDSYGQPPQTYSFPFPSNLSSLKYNSYPFQSLTSSVCGQYCIFFVYHRSHNTSLASIIQLLRSSSNPDHLVHLFVQKLKARLPSCPTRLCSLHQTCVCRNQLTH